MDRVNQQKTEKYDKPTDAEIGWLAGMIEADGTISLSCYMRKDSAKPKVGCEIKVYNTDAGIIGKVVDIVTRVGLSHYISERPLPPLVMEGGKSYGGRDPMLSVSVKKLGDALRLGKILFPHFYGSKRARLAMLIQYLAQRIKKAPTSHSTYALDKEDLTLVVDFYRQFVRNPSANFNRIEGLLRDYT